MGECQGHSLALTVCVSICSLFSMYEMRVSVRKWLVQLWELTGWSTAAAEGVSSPKPVSSALWESVFQFEP